MNVNKKAKNEVQHMRECSSTMGENLQSKRKMGTEDWVTASNSVMSESG